MTAWEIVFSVESDDFFHMEALTKLTQQYLEAAMEHTRRHDAKLIDVRLTLKEEPRADHDPAAD